MFAGAFTPQRTGGGGGGGSGGGGGVGGGGALRHTTQLVYAHEGGVLVGLYLRLRADAIAGAGGGGGGGGPRELRLDVRTCVASGVRAKLVARREVVVQVAELRPVSSARGMRVRRGVCAYV